MSWQILHIVASSRGGGAAVVYDLCQSLDHSRYAIAVAMSEDGGQMTSEKIRATGARFVPVRIASGFRPSEIMRLRQLIPNFDLLHVHGPRAALFGRLAATTMRHRPRVVYTLHGFGAAHYPRAKRTAMLALERSLSRATDRVVCVSAQERHLVAQANIVSADRLVQIDNGIDIAAYQAPAGFDRQAYRSHAGFAADTQLIVTVSRLHPQKDIASLLQAMAKIRAELPRARLWIISDGPLRSELETLAAALRLTDIVTFAGFRSDISQILNAADLFVLATHWEGMPLVLLEAMSVGLPTIGSDVIGVNDVLAGTDAGRLVPPANPDALADAIREILQDEETRRSMGERGRALIQSRFTRERMAAQMTQLYESLLEN